MPRPRITLLAAARDTLMNIAGVSGAAAKRLRPGQSLVADLGFDDPDFAVLATYQCKVGDRLRDDGGQTSIAPEELYDAVVWEVYRLTVWRATGHELEAAAANRHLAQAQAELRDGKTPFS